MLPSKDVAAHLIAVQIAVEGDGDAVVGDTVVLQDDLAVGLERRQVRRQTERAVDDLVAFEQGAARFLEADAHAGGAGGMGNHVVAYHRVVGVHQVDANCIIVKAVAVHHVVVGEHEMNRVAAAGAIVAVKQVAVGIPHHHVARIHHLVAFDAVVHAVPQADAVAARAPLLSMISSEGTVTLENFCHRRVMGTRIPLNIFSGFDPLRREQRLRVDPLGRRMPACFEPSATCTGPLSS